MVRVLSAVILLAAVSASAAPAIPSFEVSAANLQASVAALRAGQAKARAQSSGSQIDSLAWELRNQQLDAQRLRNDLRFLTARLRRRQAPQPGRPDSDPSLRWDVQRFAQDVSRLARDAQWRLNDLRFLSAQAQKDETLVAPAARLLDAARSLKSETNWFVFDARFAFWDFQRAGFTFEAMDLDRDSRDVDARAQDLQDESDRLLAKVRG